MKLFKDYLTIVAGVILLAIVLAIRFLPFLLIAWVIVHFVQKWW